MKNDIVFNILLSIVVGYLLTQLQLFLGSLYLINFLKQNLITLLVALIAINSATLSILLTKIRELIDKTGQINSFNSTKKQMILSIKEQVSIVFVAILFLIIQDSSFIKLHNEFELFLNVSITGCFIYALRILYDTAKSVFIILDY
ncbi:putative membrane protein [Aliarcobacter faecis]|uniref:hypothetical protein n=1 Tax=Aliarcobacter TaxID=2321111 RepID=UPI000479843F|nr:hypothetical protein [Aliarcobacter faecis]QKF72774.1 putative membrane protein [Aliarcobacter faecis]